MKPIYADYATDFQSTVLVLSWQTSITDTVFVFCPEFLVSFSDTSEWVDWLLQQHETVALSASLRVRIASEKFAVCTV